MAQNKCCVGLAAVWHLYCIHSCPFTVWIHTLHKNVLSAGSVCVTVQKVQEAVNISILKTYKMT